MTVDREKIRQKLQFMRQELRELKKFQGMDFRKNKAGGSSSGIRPQFFLLHRYALGQVARLVDVAAAGHGGVVGQELQGHYRNHGGKK